MFPWAVSVTGTVWTQFAMKILTMGCEPHLGEIGGGWR